MPSRLATSAWPNSWTIRDPNSTSTVITVVRYATPSELCRASRNCPDNRKINRNRIRNQLRSTPMRKPKRSISLMDWGRRHMLQWSHKAYRLPDRQSDANEMDQAMTDSFDHLRERLAALSDLRNVSQLLDW